MTEPRVLERGPDWMVLEKPSGWHTLLGGGDPSASTSVEGWLAAAHPELASLEECGLVHRLDQGTSGCLLVATEAASLGRLRAGMADGSIRKHYRALLPAAPPWGGRFELWFTSRYKRSSKVTVCEQGEPRHRGVCTWELLERGADRVLVEVELVGPGRRHQIRAGFAHLGVPLLGDVLYGGVPWSLEVPALHAFSLELPGARIESPDPLRQRLRSPS